jgi:hypothetical protein
VVARTVLGETPMASRSRASFVELRVHGVSGTPPEQLVGAHEVEQVAGDRLVRFVRARDPAARTLPDGGVLEGMSWGRLTSGPAVQVAWLLLLPFALVNLVLWAIPEDRPPEPGTAAGTDEGSAPGGRDPSGGGPEHPRRSRGGHLGAEGGAGMRRLAEAVSRDHVFRAAVRLLALGLTVLLTLAAATVTMDLVAWQCAAGGCADLPGPFAVPAGGRLGARVAVAATVPVLLLAAMAWLSHRVSLRYEAVTDRPAGQPEPTAEEVQPCLQSPLMWRGEALVARLRCLHLSAAWAAVGAVLAVGLYQARGGTPAGVVGVLFTAGSVVSAVVLAVAVATSVLPCRATRWTDGWSPSERWTSATLQWAALVGAGLCVSAFAWGYQVRADARPPMGLPALHAAFHLLGAVLLGTLLVLVLCVGRYPRMGGRAPSVTGDRSARHAPGVIAMSAVGLGYVLSAGVVVGIADLLRDRGRPPLVVPPALQWAASGFAVVVGLALLIGGGVFWGVSRLPRKDVQDVVKRVADRYDVRLGGDHRQQRTDYRVRRIVRAWRVQRAVQVSNLFAVLTGFALVAAIFSVIALLSVVTGTFTAPSWLSTAGSWAVAAVTAGLVTVTVAGWRSETWRRRIGILWDVLSFWPRGAHPLAPPSYSERAVPQLTARTCYLARVPHPRPRTGVLLSGHSQGSVLAVAVVAQLAGREPAERAPALDRTVLLTHGSPLGRLYEPLFPRYFGAAGLGAIRDAVTDGGWVNLWRDTDPIGWSLQQVLGDHDHDCTDPAGFGMDGREAAYPPIRAHGDYPADPLYARARRQLRDRLPHARPERTDESPPAVVPAGPDADVQVPPHTAGPVQAAAAR